MDGLKGEGVHVSHQLQLPAQAPGGMFSGTAVDRKHTLFLFQVT